MADRTSAAVKLQALGRGHLQRREKSASGWLWKGTDPSPEDGASGVGDGASGGVSGDGLSGDGLIWLLAFSFSDLGTLLAWRGVSRFFRTLSAQCDELWKVHRSHPSLRLSRPSRPSPLPPAPSA